MAAYTSAGTTIGLSAAAPATYDATGYAALTFTNIGEVTDLGSIPRRLYEMVQHQPIAERGMKKAKGGYSLASQTITFAIDRDDAGQALLETAARDDSSYAVKIDSPTLGTIYAIVLVLGGEDSYGDVNSIATGTATLEYVIPDGISAGEDGVVIVPAA